MRHLPTVLLLSVFFIGSSASCGGSGGAPTPAPTPPPVPVNLMNFQPAAVVVGQPDFVSSDANQGTTNTPAADTLRRPAGRAVLGSWYVPDWLNHRVLGFPAVPTTNGQAASFVLGQPDFVTGTFGLSATKMNRPADVAVGSGKMAVVEHINNRVLLWNSPPTTTGVAADIVVGQLDFTSSSAGTTQTTFDGSISVAIAGGKLFVVDVQNNRVLIWNTIPMSNGAAADVVVGQTDFVSSSFGTTAATLDNPFAVWSDGTKLVVSDSGNNRILIWNAIPTSNGVAADIVVGQATFTTSIAAAGTTGLDFPGTLVSNGLQLFVPDRNNNRVLVFDPFPTSNQPAAAVVLGQGDFTMNAANDDDQDGSSDLSCSVRTLNAPTGVSLAGDRLVVCDQSNNRILIFQGL